MTFRPNEAAIDEIVASCNGDIHGALKALLLVNEQLEAELHSFTRPWPLAGRSSAAATRCTDSASFGGGIFLRTGPDGRAGELGFIEGFIGTVLEPDIANHNRVAGHDLAFVGRAVADHPIEPLREANRSDR